VVIAEETFIENKGGNMKKRIALAITVLMVFATLFAACTGTPDAPADGGSAPAASSDGDSDAQDAPEGASAYDQLMTLLENPESALALSGVQPKSYVSREDVVKGLDNITPKAAGDIKVAWAAASLGSEFFEGLRDSAQSEAAKLGMQPIDLQSADFNLQTQQQQVDTYVTNQVDVLILNAVDLHSSTQMIKTVIDAGIPVLVTGPTAAKDEYQMITAIISGSNESGFQVGQYCAEQLYVPGEVLRTGMIISKLEDADSNSRPCGWIAGYLFKSAEINGTPYESKYDAILEAYNIWTEYKTKRSYDLSEKGLNLTQLGVGEGTSADNGRTAVQDIIVADPDMQLLVSEMDSMAVGAIPELKTQGKIPGQDIKVVTCADATTTALDLIKSGELMATATNIPFMAATSMVDIIYDLFVGGRTGAPAGASTPADAAVYYNNLPATSFTPTIAITAENVDQYYPTGEPAPFNTFAKYDPYTPLSVDEYNALHTND
jgi:ribose transport system substrate-binding protein